MIMKLRLAFVLCLSLIVSTSIAQNIKNEPAKPNFFGTPTSFKYVTSLASRAELPPAEDKGGEMQDGRSWKYDVIVGKGTKSEDLISKPAHRLKNTIQARIPELVFQSGASTSQPTDPAGAVGPNHYVAVINTSISIFDKSGNLLTGPLAPSAIFGAGSYCCDLTASYDNAADRWVLTILGSGATVAVSDGPNPVTAGWYVYTYAQVVDYQKLSVWSDGYYMTDNTGAANKAYVFERAQMLVGNPAAQIIGFPLPGIATSGFYSPQAFNVINSDLPATGSAPIVYMADDAWGGVAQDHIKLWEVDVDWVTPANSTVSNPPLQIGIDGGTGTVSPFIGVFDAGSFSNLTQPGGGAQIDALQATIMNQAQFRSFPSHNSAVFNFVIDADPTAGELAAVRWYELRQSGDGQPWSVYQEGTYTAPDGKHAWNASMGIDIQGNIGMGYTAMGGPTTPGTVHAGSYYTGRFSADPLGTMTVSEEVIQSGNASIPSLRYGDYSKLDLDPSNDKKFWFNNELMNSGRKNYVGVFQIAPNFNDDVGVVSVDTPTTGALSNSETVTVTVFNYGQNSASGFDVTYQVDGGSVITEAFAGSLASATSAQHVFATTADLSTEGQTYSIMACTDLSGDEDNGNDCTTANVLHVYTNDIGVTAITAPVSGEGLGNETVTVTIENFGTSDQTGFDVNYIIDAGTPVVETVGMNVPAGGSISYSFVAQANLSTTGTYNFTSSTLLGSDSDNGNDTAMSTVTNVSCLTNSNATVQAIGPNAATVTTSVINFTNDFVINDVNVTIDIDHTWVGDLDIKLTAPDGITEVELLANGTCGNCDDMDNVLFDDEASTSINSATAPIAGPYQPASSLTLFDGLMSAGDWTLTITDNANGDGGNLVNWDLQLCSNSNLSIDDNELDVNLEIYHLGNSLYSIKLPTSAINERLELTVFNMLGQQVYWRTLDNTTGNGYEHELNMSYASAGIYLVRIGNKSVGTYKRIIVE